MKNNINKNSNGVSNIFLDKKFFVTLIFALFLLLLSFWAVDGYLDLNKKQKSYGANMKDSIGQRLTPLFSEINSFSKSSENDILFLRQISSLNNILNVDNKKLRDGMTRDLEVDFLGFLREHVAYSSLRYINKKGDEVASVVFDGKAYRIVTKEDFNNKKGFGYFDVAIGLSERDILISNLMLTDEENSSSDRTIMRYSTPVFDYKGAVSGTIVLDIDADYFLEDIRRFQREEERVFLLNREGYYLVHPDGNKEFDFAKKKNSNFYEDYPEVSKNILTDSKIRKFETDKYFFSFRHIYPTEGSFEIHKASQKIFGEKPKDNYLWILVSVSSLEDMNNVSLGIKKDYVYALLFSATVVFLIIVLIFILVFKFPDDKDYA